MEPQDCLDKMVLQASQVRMEPQVCLDWMEDQVYPEVMEPLELTV